MRTPKSKPAALDMIDKSGSDGVFTKPEAPKAVSIKDIDRYLRFVPIWIEGDPELRLRMHKTTKELVAFPDYLGNEDEYDVTDLVDYTGEGQCALLAGPLKTEHHLEYSREYMRPLETSVQILEDAHFMMWEYAQMAEAAQELATGLKVRYQEVTALLADMNEGDEGYEDHQKEIEELQAEARNFNLPPYPIAADGTVTTVDGTTDGGLGEHAQKLCAYLLSCYGRVLSLKPPYDKHPNQVVSHTAYELEPISYDEVCALMPGTFPNEDATIAYDGVTEKTISTYRYLLWLSGLMTLAPKTTSTDPKEVAPPKKSLTKSSSSGNKTA